MSSHSGDRDGRRPSTSITVAASLLLAAAPALAGFAGTDLFLPMAGRQAGVHPSNWYTKVWIHNPGVAAATARIYFLQRGTANPSPPWVDVLVAGGDTEAIDNVVETLFHLEAFGALRVTCATQTLIVTSRVYSRGDGLGDRDSVGQDFAGVPASFAIGLNETAQVLGVHQSLPAEGSVFRFNYGLVETTGNTATVRVTATGGDNQPLGTEDLQVREWSQRQVAFADHFPGVSTENARLSFLVVAGSGRIIGYGSGIANGSQDPTTFEMSYRNELLAAGAADGVPSGAVWMFDLPACPAGWTALAAARGRALVGLPDGGTGAGTVGSPLADLENRQHTHVVNPEALPTTATGGHSHTVGPIAVPTTSVASHTHSVDVPWTESEGAPAHNHTVAAIGLSTASAGAHNHKWAAFIPEYTNEWRSYDVNGDPSIMMQTADGLNMEGSGTYPIALSGAGATYSQFYTQNESAHFHAATVPERTVSLGGIHDHGVDPAAFASASAGSHSHNVSIAEATSTTTGSHFHTADIPATESTPAATASVMPYVQLLVCRKD